MSSATYVKICGITTLADMSAAVAGGADAVGFLVGLAYPSEDELDPDKAKELVLQLPPFVSSVLVTHRAEVDAVEALCRRVPASHLQLHGPFPIHDIPKIREQFPYLKIIKALHVVDSTALQVAHKISEYVDGLILDTKTPTRIGGTGKVHDWSISRAIRDAVYPKPVILAGGLNPDNLRHAIFQVLPFAVDVNSGVSLRRGLKSHELVSRFISIAKSGKVL